MTKELSNDVYGFCVTKERLLKKTKRKTTTLLAMVF